MVALFVALLIATLQLRHQELLSARAEALLSLDVHTAYLRAEFRLDAVAPNQLREPLEAVLRFVG